MIVNLLLAAQFLIAPYIAEGYATTENSEIYLQRMKGTCEMGKRAVLSSMKFPVVWIGCWQQLGNSIFMQWEDGDNMAMPASEVQWIKLPDGPAI